MIFVTRKWWKQIINPNLFSDYLWKFEGSRTRSYLMLKSRSIWFQMYIRMWYRLWINWCTGNLSFLAPKLGKLFWQRWEFCTTIRSVIFQIVRFPSIVGLWTVCKLISRTLWLDYTIDLFDWPRVPSEQHQFENQPYQFRNRLNSS